MNEPVNQKTTIFDIKRYSINDGPGIRITLFFKGCPLRCAWCHNPESISGKIEKMYSPAKCIGAKVCIEVCPVSALKLTTQGIITDYNLCTMCGNCADVCPTKAIEMSGYHETIENIISEIEKERLITDQSGGGVTFSGGEPLLHHIFLIKLLDECGVRGFHRAVDTSGYCDTKTILNVAKRTDLFLYDLKMMDNVKHKRFTGVGNEKIIHNLQKLSKTGADINIRIPLISGVNSDIENIEKSAIFISGLKGEKKIINLLPFHSIASHKYKKLGKEFNQGETNEPTSEEIERAIIIFRSYGLEAITGG